MNKEMDINLLVSTHTAIMRLARAFARPDGMCQADFERYVAREVAKHATSVAEMDDSSLEILRAVVHQS